MENTNLNIQPLSFTGPRRHIFFKHLFVYTLMLFFILFLIFNSSFERGCHIPGKHGKPSS